MSLAWDSDRPEADLRQPLADRDDPDRTFGCWLSFNEPRPRASYGKCVGTLHRRTFRCSPAG